MTSKSPGNPMRCVPASRVTLLLLARHPISPRVRAQKQLDTTKEKLDNEADLKFPRDPQVCDHLVSPTSVKSAPSAASRQPSESAPSRGFAPSRRCAAHASCGPPGSAPAHRSSVG